MELLIKIYSNNYNPLGPIGLQPFIEVLTKLALGFTELQVLKIAAACTLFPDDDSNFYGHRFSPLPQFQPDVGELGQAIYRNGILVSWKRIGRSCHIQDKVRSGRAF